MASTMISTESTSEGHAVGLRAEDLGSAQAVGHGAPCGPLGEAGGRQRHRQRDGVGEHVRGVGEQRERGGEHARR